VVGLASYSYLWPAAGATHSLFLKELYVRDSARRHGIASALIDALRSIAAQAGCSRMEWLADRDNPAALAFYEALGVTPLNGKLVYRLDSEALTSSS
jgi:GNAT superfamily N-acetyltransferase